MTSSSKHNARVIFCFTINKKKQELIITCCLGKHINKAFSKKNNCRVTLSVTGVVDYICKLQKLCKETVKKKAFARKTHIFAKIKFGLCRKRQREEWQNQRA
jgi:hypothetical protein